MVSQTINYTFKKCQEGGEGSETLSKMMACRMAVVLTITEISLVVRLFTISCVPLCIYICDI